MAGTFPRAIILLALNGGEALIELIQKFCSLRLGRHHVWRGHSGHLAFRRARLRLMLFVLGHGPGAKQGRGRKQTPSTLSPTTGPASPNGGTRCVS